MSFSSPLSLSCATLPLPCPRILLSAYITLQIAEAPIISGRPSRAGQAWWRGGAHIALLVAQGVHRPFGTKDRAPKFVGEASRVYRAVVVCGRYDFEDLFQSETVCLCFLHCCLACSILFGFRHSFLLFSHQSLETDHLAVASPTPSSICFLKLLFSPQLGRFSGVAGRLSGRRRR